MRTAAVIAAGLALGCLLFGCGKPDGSPASPPSAKSKAPSEVVIKYCTG